jgi:RND family efflux transporter MFP subunit
VSVAAVTRATAHEAVTVTGVVRPHREAEVVAKVQGRVTQVLVALGEQVKVGQLLAVVEHEELGWQARQAQAAIETAQAGLESARQNLETVETQFGRVKALREAEAIPQVEFERTEALVKGARTGVKAAEAQLSTARAAAGLAGQMVKNAELRSPIAGVVSRKSVDVGGQASQQVPPFQIQDLSTLRLEAPVAAQALPRIRVGQTAEITSEIVPGTVFSGTVSAVGPGLDPMARRGTVEIDMPQGEGAARLVPNQMVRAVIAVGQRPNALAVPRAALVQAGGAQHVFVVRGGKAQRITLKAPSIDGDLAFIDDELGEGEQVVVTGRDALFDGARVTVTEQPAGSVARRKP